MGWGEGRFYTIEGRDYPSVTTILGVIDKSGPLMAWAVNQQDRLWESSLLEVLTDPAMKSRDQILAAVSKMMHKAKAAEKTRNQAAEIGTAAHALVEWHTRRMLGEDAGAEPRVPDAALLAVESWKDWVKQVNFQPVWCERVVHSKRWGYAGTGDWKGYVNGVMTLGDIKTGKGIYPEAWLQNRAYRSADEETSPRGEEWGEEPATQGVILRLPKSLEDPTFEAQVVPETSLEDFLAAKRLWEWTRTSRGKAIDRK